MYPRTAVRGISDFLCKAAVANDSGVNSSPEAGRESVASFNVLLWRLNQMVLSFLVD